jgi:peptidoglycan/xylan/chitin deacetylase (PgdA/CDA1 family)
LLERLPPPGAPVLSVLTYHRIGEHADGTVAPGLLSATLPEFERQMRFVAERRLAVSIDEVLAAQVGGNALAERAVLVTFDDAYPDFATLAWPVLRRFAIPAVLFVPTGFPGQPGRTFWWERLYDVLRHAGRGAIASTRFGELRLGDIDAAAGAYRSLRAHLKALPTQDIEEFVDELTATLGAPMSHGSTLEWADLRTLASEGLSLAPHSVNHPLLPGLDDDTLAAEILGSTAELQAQTGASLPVFAYPSGAHDDRVVAAVKAAGFAAAFTTVRGVNRLEGRATDRWLRLRRINVGSRSNVRTVRAQLVPVLARSSRWSGDRARPRP